MFLCCLWLWLRNAITFSYYDDDDDDVLIVCVILLN